MFLSRMPSSSLRRFSPSLLSEAVAFIALARLIGSEKCSVNRPCASTFQFPSDYFGFISFRHVRLYLHYMYVRSSILRAAAAEIYDGDDIVLVRTNIHARHP